MQSEGHDNFTAKLFTPARFASLLALLVAATFPQILLGWESLVARDFGFFAFPLAQFQQDSFWRGELPFWNPYNHCGVPFIAQWNTMPLYPPALLYLTLPLEWALSNFGLLHLWWAGLGMYFLARRWVGNDFAAAFAGVAFAFNGFTLNLLMWPSHIATFAWLPWVILTAQAAWREGGRKIFIAAIVGALQMLAGGPETILLTWLIASALWLTDLFANHSARPKIFYRFPVVVAFVFSLSAIQLLPFLDLVAHAQRESGYTDLRWSLPGFGLANFLVPMAFGNTLNSGIFFQHGQYWTSSYYLGMGTLWLMLLALFGRRNPEKNSPPVRLLSALGLVSLLCALGENTPAYPLLRKLIPQLSFITYPVKFIMLAVFIAPVLAALTWSVAFQTLGSNGETKNSETDRQRRDFQKKLFGIGGVLLALSIGIIVWTQTAPLPGDDTAAAWNNGLSRLAYLIVIGVIFFGLTRRHSSPLLRWLPLVLLLVMWRDVITHQPRQNPTVSPSVFERNLVRTRLAMNPQPELGGARAMLSPTAALELTRFGISDAKANFLAKRVGYCANANLLDAVPKVDGFVSLAPREFDALLTTIYSVTNGNFSALMDFMGVAQITSAENVLAWQPRATFLPLITAGQRPVYATDAEVLGALARNDFEGARMVFLPPEEKNFVTVSNATAATILNHQFTRQGVSVEVQAMAPSLVVVAQSYYHNWRVTIDGQPARLLRANAAFQAVEVPAGNHRVEFRYHDRAFELGALLSGGAWLLCLGALRWRRTRA